MGTGIHRVQTGVPPVLLKVAPVPILSPPPPIVLLALAVFPLIVPPVMVNLPVLL